MKNDVSMLHLLLSLLGVRERVVKSGIKKALDLANGSVKNSKNGSKG